MVIRALLTEDPALEQDPALEKGPARADDGSVGARVALVDPLVAIGAEARPPHPRRPWLMSNMVTTLDGATAIDGVSGPLGGPADKAVFSAIRAAADVVLVGAATAIQESYRPPPQRDEIVAHRRARGGHERLTVAVVTASLSIEPTHPLFADPAYRPLILTVSDAPGDRRELLEAHADLIDTDVADGPAGPGRVDLRRALELLHDLGHGVVLSEGGPSLNGQLVAADLIDEWNMTLSPMLASGSSRRAADGPPTPHRERLHLTRLWEGDGLLFGRWIRR